jgi:hypothetical protein
MAFMGVKWGGGGGGMGGMSGVADVFAKAMFGDPEREMKLALGRSDLETDLYRRAQIESAQRANEALTAARQQETDARIAGGRALGQAWFNQQNPDAGTAPDVGSADAPVPVEDVPIPTPSVAPRAAAPLQEGPAPIEIPSQVEPNLRVSTFPMKQQVMTPENPFQTQAPPVPVQTGVEPDFNISTAAPPIPVAERPADPYFEALDTYTQGDRRLRTVPPDLVAPDTSQTQVPGRPIMETFRDRPPPPSLQEEQISTGPNEPAIVEVPGRETPGTTVFAPPVDPRMEQRPTPLTEGTAATPATATGDPLAAGAPAQKPQVMPGPQPGTVAVTDPVTGQHTIITEDQAIAIATALVTQGGNVGANMGAIQGALEMIGKPGQTPDVRTSTLYTGDNPSKDSAAAQVSGDIPAGAAGGPFEGTGMDAQYQNVIFRVGGATRDPKGTVTPDDARLYAAAVSNQYGTKTELRQTDQGTVEIPIREETPPGLTPVEDVFKRAGITLGPVVQKPDAGAPSVADVTAAAGGGVGTGTEPSVVAGTGTTTATQPTSTAPAETDTPSYTEPTVGPNGEFDPASYRIVVPAKKGKMTEKQGQYTAYYLTGKAANEALKNTKTPGVIQSLIGNPGNVNMVAQIARLSMSEPETRRYYMNALNFASSVLRMESGAATRVEELPIVFARFIDEAGDPPDMKATKAAYREAALEGLRLGAIGEEMSGEEIYQYAVANAKNVGAANNAGTGTGTSTVTGTKPTRKWRRVPNGQ